MKIKALNGIAMLLASGFIVTSCSQEAPFESGSEGQLKMNTVLRGNISVETRGSIEGYEDDYLNENLMVYIENSKGVIRKYQGKDQIPESISLPVGSYVVEGWTGDSVSASFEKKFFRGYKKDVSVGAGVNELSLNLDIANVLVSVDKSSLSEISNLKVKFYHSRGELVFTEEEINAEKRGYFMLPNADKDIHYLIEGTNKLGEPFTKPGDIKNVERAHLYNLKLTSEQPENSLGGAIIRLVIEDIPVIEERFEILPPPSIKATYGGDDWNLDYQIVSTTTPKEFVDLRLRALAYDSMEALSISFDSKISGVEDLDGLNLMEEDVEALLAQHNIELNVVINDKEPSALKNSADLTVIEAYLTFKSEFFNNLPENSEEYVVAVTAKDSRGYEKTSNIKIANSDAAVAQPDPVASVEFAETKVSPMDILSDRATLKGLLYDNSAADYGFLYREKDSEAFRKISVADLTRAERESMEFSVEITGLEPGKTYEYKAYADNFEEPDRVLKTFTTEEKYAIPNGNMSDWAKNGNMYIPSASGKVEYWDNGNHGSYMIAIGGMNISLPDDTFLPDGNRVGKLQSGSVYNVMAAGNLFIGEYLKNDGMSGADLNFGREFNGSHPSALKVKVNYKPGKVNKYTDTEATADLENGGTDHGQIFVAIASAQSELHTGKNVMFDPHADNILGYGEITWKAALGEDNSLVDITIPIEYYEKAKTTPATHLMVVCSASKYGDYFTGSTSSVMYVDDFELDYGEIHWAE